MKKKQRILGFTLIELLVVISIIGILITIGVAAFINAQRRARDTKRRTDLRDLANAAEQYYLDNSNTYTSACASSFSNLAPYLSEVPVDPQTGLNYGCAVTATNDGFCMIANIEDTTKGNCSACAGGVMATTTTNRFCIVNKQ